jgi:hypothetical protein
VSRYEVYTGIRYKTQLVSSVFVYSIYNVYRAGAGGRAGYRVVQYSTEIDFLDLRVPGTVYPYPGPGYPVPGYMQ